MFTSALVALDLSATRPRPFAGDDLVPDEGLWVSKPKNARVFYDVVLGLLDEHIGPAATVSAKAR
jgi:hypothetical protein